MELRFSTNGNEKQKECAKYWIDHTTEEIYYGGSKGSGKSYLGANLVFGDALMYPNTHQFIARKKLNDLRRFTIPTIHEVLESWNIGSQYYSYNGQDSVFNLYNGSKVFLLDAKYLPSDPQYQRFGSMQMTKGWIEEGGEFESDSYKNLKISIGRWKNDIYNLPKKLLTTMNPAKNYLYKDVYKPFKDGSLPEWVKFIQALPYDNKMLPDGYLQNLERTLTGSEKKRLLHGDWEYDDSPNALCHYDNIIQIFKNDHIAKGKKYITADIARLGSDKAVIMVWNGWNVIEIVTFGKSKLTELQTTIQALQVKHQISSNNVIADEDGVGGGVVDNLHIKGFVNNARPKKDENYQNLKTQCAYKLAEIINLNQIYISADISDKVRDTIVEEIEQLQSYDMDKDSKLRILPKEKIKANIGRSPDYLDALLMRSYFDYVNTEVVFY